MKYLILMVLILILIYIYFHYKNSVPNIKNTNKPQICFLGNSRTYKVFEDYIVSLTYKLKKYNIDYSVFTNNKYSDSFFHNTNRNTYYIIIHTTEHLDISTETKEKIINNTFIINTEQLSRKEELVRILNYVKEGYKIIDYSIGNIRILDKNHTLNIFYIPYQVNYDEIINENKYRPKDICTITPYSSSNRKNIYTSASSTNLFKITEIYGFGKIRDRELVKHKILLNIHYDANYTTYESIRCDRLIFNKVIILSEYSNEKSIPEDLKEYIIQFSNIEELKTKLEILSNNTENFYKNFWTNFNLEEIDKNREKYFNYWLNTIKNTESFININEAYVINLDNRTDRWEQIQSSFKDSKIQLNRVSAVKHKIGHIGCGLSFMKIVKLAKEKKLKTVLIFEDDNKPLDNFDKRWNTIKTWLDNNLEKWEVFNGGARFEGWDNIDNSDIPNNCKNIKLVNNINNKEYLFTNDIMLSTNWIYINSSVYDKILKWEKEIDYNNFNLTKHPIDRYITNPTIFNVQFCLPLLALQQNGESNTSYKKNNYFDYDDTDKFMIKVYKKIYDKYVFI